MSLIIANSTSICSEVDFLLYEQVMQLFVIVFYERTLTYHRSMFKCVMLEKPYTHIRKYI